MSRPLAARSSKRKVRLAEAAVLITLLFGACKAPLMSTLPQQFSLRITFPVDAADVPRSLRDTRLLLPNATSLDVAMEPLDFRFTPLERVVAIPSGATSVVVPFTRVPEGSWKVRATASDAGGTKLFSQTKTIDISAANASFDFPLLPLLSTGLQSSGSTPSQFASVDVPAHDSLSWTIPAEAIKADGNFEVWLDPSTGLKGAYIQYADGRNASYPVSASGAGSYVTVYNPTGAPARAFLLLDPYHVNYDGNQTGYQNATGTAPKDVDSAGYAKGYGPSTDYPRATVLGAANLAVKGYSFSGWNTGASGSGTAYAVGDPLTVTSDTLLYAQWAQIHVTGIALNKTTDVLLAVGDTDTLTATVTPSEALDISVTWTSSDATVVSVSNGAITALQNGVATITATTTDGGFTASCVVTAGTQSSVTATFSIASDPTQVLGFSPASVTVASSATLTLATGNATLASQGRAWRWSVDGVIDAAATSSTYTRVVTVSDIGQHIVSVSCLYEGLRYSGDLMVTVR